MRAIERLRHEHRMIDRMLDHLERSLHPFSVSAVSRSVHFFLEWVDEIHHPKEEEVLFQELLLRARAVAVGPIQVMRKEHAVARAYLSKAQQIIGEGDQIRSRELLTRYLRAFVSMFREHIVMEDRALFVLSEQMIPPSMDDLLLERFDQVTRGRLDRESLAAYERIAENPDDTMVIRRPPPEPVTEKRSKAPSNLDAKTLSGDGELEVPDEVTYTSAKTSWKMFDRGDHRNIRLHDFSHGLSVQANQFVIVDHGKGMVLDPGGPKVYPNVYAETMMELDEGALEYIFLSHQDPDICTSLNAWLMDTKADAIVSRLWIRFLPHFGIDRLLEDRLKPIPDGGGVLRLGESDLLILPAHFLHSCGNFHVYDPISKTLFSGDLGASVGVEATHVSSFEGHVDRMAGFHRRYMATNAALKAYVSMVEKLDIEVIAPQHGAALVGKQTVHQFFEWLAGLPCGIDVMAPTFAVPTAPLSFDGPLALLTSQDH
jgi:hemerythrin-like domain-containing protein/glyoxylase-like metal-dependent hydrolase (beta-lactamase superfamily II)